MGVERDPQKDLEILQSWLGDTDNVFLWPDYRLAGAARAATIPCNQKNLKLAIPLDVLEFPDGSIEIASSAFPGKGKIYPDGRKEGRFDELLVAALAI